MLLAAMAVLIACGQVDPAIGVTPVETPVQERSGGILPPTPTTVPLFTESGLIDPLDTVPDVRLVGITGWINSPELNLDQLRANGRVVLLDFWTYTCVNCVRTFPFLRAMHDRYSELGLTLIGVHSPEFEFERDSENVAAAVAAADLPYAVALDSDSHTWDSFNNHFWPTSYLIGVDGAVRYRHFGEGGYTETEEQIRQALTASGVDLAGVPHGGDFQQQLADAAYTQTREIYAGYAQGFQSSGLFAAQDAYYLSPDASVDYMDTGLRRHGQFELDGRWRNEVDAIAYVGSATDSGYIVFPFFATSVNAVMSPHASPATVFVEMDGEPIPQSAAGPDVTYDSSGRSVVTVDAPRLYRIVQSDQFGRHELELLTSSDDLRIYSFTFGVFSKSP